MTSRTKAQRVSPNVWLGQSVDTSSICANVPELRKAAFLTSLGCAIRRPSLQTTHFNSALRKKLGVTGPLMIDSGGFALMNSPNTHWTVRKVGDLIEQIDADVFVSLDFPPSMKDDKVCRRAKIKASAKNFALLSNRFPHKTIMPVIHGRTTEEIQISINEIVRRKRNPTWVGLGGIVPLLQNQAPTREISALGPEVFIGLALSLIRGAFPAAKIHAFGAGGPRTFPALFALGADSGDSIGWRQAAGFGSIFLPLKTQRAVVWNREKRPPRKLIDKTDLAQIDLCGCPTCTSVDSTSKRMALLTTSFHYRAIHNAWTVTNQHKYWPKTRLELRNMLRAGVLGLSWAAAVGAQVAASDVSVGLQRSPIPTGIVPLTPPSRPQP